MKKITLIPIFLLFLSQSLIAQEQNFTVSGHIKGLDTEQMGIVYKNKQGNLVRDKIKVTGDSFSYTGNIGKMAMVTIWTGVDRVMKRVGRGFIPVKSSKLLFIAYPGANVTFSGKITDFIDAYPSDGSIMITSPSYTWPFIR